MSSTPDFGNAFFSNPFVSSSAVATPAEKVNTDDLDLSAKTALEVKITWGDQILFVTHLSPARDVFVGDEAEGPVDYKLPCARVQIARVEGDSIFALGESGSVPLSRGQSNTRKLGELEVRVASVAAAVAPKGKNKARKSALLWWGASAALHLAIIGGLTMSPGASLDDESAPMDKSTQAYMLAMQNSAASREIPEQEQESGESSTSAANSSAGGKHAGAAGQMGSPDKNMTGGHYQVKGPPESQEQKLAKTHALIESNSYGAIGALASVFGATSKAPVSFNGGDESIGKDPADFNGNFAGDHPGDSFGYLGLAPAGTGPGGGGWSDGIGLNQVGGFGHTCITGNCGPGADWSGGPGGKPLTYKPKGTKMYDTNVVTTGHLPPETIKRVIRANFPRFRACYEAGLKKDPGLKGSVAVRFIIDTTGAIENASLAGGSMSDTGVSSCVLGVYQTLSFPEPESGKVMVTYPIDFQNE